MSERGNGSLKGSGLMCLDYWLWVKERWEIRMWVRGGDGMVGGKAGEVNREWYSRKIMDEMSRT